MPRNTVQCTIKPINIHSCLALFLFPYKAPLQLTAKQHVVQPWGRFYRCLVERHSSKWPSEWLQFYNTHTQMKFKHELTRSLFPYPNVRLLVSFYFSPRASQQHHDGRVHSHGCDRCLVSCQTGCSFCFVKWFYVSRPSRLGSIRASVIHFRLGRAVDNKKKTKPAPGGRYCAR